MPNRDFFVSLLESLLEYYWADLDLQFHRSCELRNNPEWTWYVFVQSYATNGGVKKWETFIERGRFVQISWQRIANEYTNDPEQTILYLNEISAEFLSNRRMHDTQPALIDTFQRFFETGGPLNIARQWEDFTQPAELFSYLKSFRQIGDKYARNMCMDVAYPLALNNFALDSRLISILKEIEEAQEIRGYRNKENWLITATHDIIRRNPQYVGLCCWHIDRLLFQKEKAIKQIFNIAREPFSIRQLIANIP